jgi:hypothetical protein
MGFSLLDRLLAFLAHIGIAFKVPGRDGVFNRFLHRFIILLDAINTINIAIIDIIPDHLLFFGFHHMAPLLAVSGILPRFSIIYWRSLRLPAPSSSSAAGPVSLAPGNAPGMMGKTHVERGQSLLCGNGLGNQGLIMISLRVLKCRGIPGATERNDG